jgi:hypothetical protein
LDLLSLGVLSRGFFLWVLFLGGSFLGALSGGLFLGGQPKMIKKNRLFKAKKP